MADSDCSNCQWNHYNGGSCPYDEYDCVFGVFNSDADDNQMKSVIAGVTDLKQQVEKLKSQLDTYGIYSNTFDVMRSYVSDFAEELSQERWDEFKKMRETQKRINAEKEDAMAMLASCMQHK